MTDYVVYHNPDTRNFSAADCNDFSVLTNNSVPNEVVGSRIWLLTGEGKPRRYYLAQTFIAENITPGDAEGFKNCISAATGQRFLPMVPIDSEEWFPDFLNRQGNFAFGFAVIREGQVIRGLLEIVARASANNHIAIAYDFKPFCGGAELSEYVSRFRRSGLPPIEVSEPLDLYPSLPTPANFNPNLTWANPWPFGESAGVYLLYSESFELLYIGKASMKRALGNRLWEYFGGDSTCTPKAEWLKPVRFVITIGVPEGMAFEAPAIEEFLIKKLKPKSNGTGK